MCLDLVQKIGNSRHFGMNVFVSGVLMTKKTIAVKHFDEVQVTDWKHQHFPVDMMFSDIWI